MVSELVPFWRARGEQPFGRRVEKMVRSRAGMEAAVMLQAVGAFNLSLVRGCAHYCKLNSLGSSRRVTTMRATVICPRGTCIYVRYCVWWKTVGEPDAHRPGYRIYSRSPYDTLRSWMKEINFSREWRCNGRMFGSYSNHELHHSRMANRFAKQRKELGHLFMCYIQIEFVCAMI